MGITAPLKGLPSKTLKKLLADGIKEWTEAGDSSSRASVQTDGKYESLLLHSYNNPAAIYQEISELYGDAVFIHQQDLIPAHIKLPNVGSVTGLCWPANSPDLNPWRIYRVLR